MYIMHTPYIHHAYTCSAPCLCHACDVHVPSRPPPSPPRLTRGTRCRTSRSRRTLTLTLALTLPSPNPRPDPNQVTAHLDELNGQRWWSVRQSKRDASPFNTTVDDGVRLVAAADRLAGGTAASSLTGGGVLAFYLLVVVGIGRAVRSSCGGTRYRLAVDEMPDTRDVIDLCEGVYIARREGQLLRETELQEADRHNCWVSLFPYLSPIYLSLYLYLSLEIDLYRV